MYKLSKGFLFFLLFLSISSCFTDKGKKIPDVSHIEVNLDIQHFEKDLMALDTQHIQSGIDALLEKYPIFLGEVFLPRILPALQDTNNVALFISSPGIQKLYDTCSTVFGDAKDIENELESVFRFYKYYFPQKNIPKVVSYISEYTIGTFTYEQDLLGIGWDFFLGENYPYYNPNFFPQYIRRTMNKEHLVAKAVEALSSDLVGEATGERMLDIMVNNGKTLYIMDQLLPLAPDSIRLGYTAEQVEWCKINEFGIWTHFLREELLYSTRRKDIRKLVDHSPSSPGMPEGAPGRTANWLGWQIVKSYMKRHPQTSLDELIALKDAQQLLDQSRYKPRR